MQKRFVALLSLIFCLFFLLSAQDNYIKIDAKVNPKRIGHGYEGVLKIKITPKNGIKISSNPELEIKLNENNNLSFSKNFFTASELAYPTKLEDGSVFLSLEKEIEIPFKVKENSHFLGRLIIRGEVIFTAVFKDKWSLKTYKKFYADFVASKKFKAKKK